MSDLPSPVSAEVSGHGSYRDDPVLTEVLSDMNVGALYGSEQFGAFLEDGDGNWFSFGGEFTNSAGESMAEWSESDPEPATTPSERLESTDIFAGNNEFESYGGCRVKVSHGRDTFTEQEISRLRDDPRWKLLWITEGVLHVREVDQ